GLVLSSISPSEALLLRSFSISPAERIPALLCGRMPAANASSHAWTRYSAGVPSPRAAGEAPRGEGGRGGGPERAREKPLALTAVGDLRFVAEAEQRLAAARAQ